MSSLSYNSHFDFFSLMTQKSQIALQVLYLANAGSWQLFYQGSS